MRGQVKGRMQRIIILGMMQNRAEDKGLRLPSTPAQSRTNAPTQRYLDVGFEVVARDGTIVRGMMLYATTEELFETCECHHIFKLDPNVHERRHALPHWLY